MSLVAGVDFGTLNVRVSIVDRERGRIASGIAEYPLQGTDSMSVILQIKRPDVE